MSDPDPSDFDSMLALARRAQARMDEGPAGPAAVGFDSRVMARIGREMKERPVLGWSSLWRALSGFAAAAGAVACVVLVSAGRDDAVDDLVSFWAAGDRAWTLVVID